MERVVSVRFDSDELLRIERVMRRLGWRGRGRAPVIRYLVLRALQAEEAERARVSSPGSPEAQP